MDERVLSIIANTRDMLLPHWGNVEAKAKPGEHTAALVFTELDLAVEQYLRTELHRIDSSIQFVGEEFGGSRDASRYWLCDPIDGTMHFVRGMPFCSVMLALIEDGRATFSVIYDFIRNNMYHARRGQGAYMDRAAIRVSARPIEAAFLAYETRLEEPANRVTLERVQQRAMIFSAVTSGFEFMQVAAGRLDGRICADAYGKDYDFIPGMLLVEEAGGIVSNIGTREYDIRNLNVIAANPLVYKALTEGPEAIFPIAT